jgi:hypothetical protein
VVYNCEIHTINGLIYDPFVNRKYINVHNLD